MSFVQSLIDQHLARTKAECTAFFQRIRSDPLVTSGDPAIHVLHDSELGNSFWMFLIALFSSGKNSIVDAVAVIGPPNQNLVPNDVF